MSKAHYGEEKIAEDVSGYYISGEIGRTHEGRAVALPAEKWVVFQAMSNSAFIAVLITLAGNVKLSKYKKHRRGPKKEATKKKSSPKTPHVSTDKLLKENKNHLERAAIVHLSAGEAFSKVIESPEWSFGSAVLFGQTIAKLVAGFSVTPTKKWEIAVFVITSIIVLGLVPSLIVLSLLLVLNPVPHGLVITQVALFLLSTIIFYGFGGAGHVQSHPVGGVKLDNSSD